MHLISARRVKEAAAKYPDVDRIIRDFCKKVEQAEWQSIIDVQQDYRTAEAVRNFTVININWLDRFPTSPRSRESSVTSSATLHFYD